MAQPGKDNDPSSGVVIVRFKDTESKTFPLAFEARVPAEVTSFN